MPERDKSLQRTLNPPIRSVTKLRAEKAMNKQARISMIKLGVRTWQRMVSWAVLFSAIGLTGCGYSDGVPRLYRVKGVVTLDGKPVPAATVIFQPITKSEKDFARVCLCLSNEQGQVAPWTMVEGDGLAAGKYRVGVYSVEQTGGTKQEELPLSDQDKKVKIRYLVPKRYMDSNNSGIEIEVTKSGKLVPDAIALLSDK